MIPIVWWSFFELSQARGYADQEIFEWLFRQRVPGGFQFEHYDTFPDADGIILVTPGHWRDGKEISEQLAAYRWVLVLMNSDEEGDCPFWEIDHPNMPVWRFHARPAQSHQPDRWLPLGWAPGTLEANREHPVKTVDWLFAGQVTHSRREEAVAAMRKHLTVGIKGVLHETTGFMQGWDQAHGRSDRIGCGPDHRPAFTRRGGQPLGAPVPHPPTLPHYRRLE